VTTTRQRLLAIVGPTAAGKSALAVTLALEFGGEVVNADSRLFYRGLDIGTAKPALAERRGVPHHLIDVLAPSDRYSLASFLDAARAAISGIASRGRLPILAGGTGQYTWALLEGWAVLPVAPDAALRSELEALYAASGAPALLDRLRRLDPDAAARVDPLNPRRLVRAIEKASVPAGRSTGPARAAEPPYDSLVLGLTVPRPALYARIDARVQSMLEAGWLDEVRTLLAAGVPRESPAMSSIGYRELAAHLAGEMSLEDAVVGAKRATRQLVRRQYNWFKPSDPRIAWLDAVPGVEAGAARAVSAWLTGLAG
jgi:tRNA dimethylallyltransferase